MFRYITNAKIVTPKKIVQGNIVINKKGAIFAISSSRPEKNVSKDSIFDGKGMYVLPGLIEVHGHMREPGMTHKEDIPHGTRAAIAGGYTTIFDMPNTDPPITTAYLVDEQIKRYEGRSYSDFAINMGTSKIDIEELKKIDKRKITGVKIFTAGHATTPTTVSSIETLAEIFEILGKRKIIAIVHAEQQELVNYFTKKYRYLIKRNDSLAWSEARNVSVVLTSALEMISLAKYFKVKLYLVHLSTTEEFQAVHFGKSIGVDVYGEMMAHELTFNTNHYKKFGNLINIAPPIRSPHNQAQLWKLLQAGNADVVCAEHAPHTLEEKRKSVWEAASGIPSIQESLPALITGWTKKFGKKNFEEGLLRIAQVMSFNTAHIFGFGQKGGIVVGKDADLTVVDTKRLWKVKKKDLFSKCGWSAYEGMELIGRPIATFLRGELVYNNGVVIGEPRGRFLQRK